jgi:hypothetical protein
MSWISKALKSPTVTTILKGAAEGAKQAAFNEAQRALDNSLKTLVDKGDARAAIRKLGVRLAEARQLIANGRPEGAAGLLEKTILDVERSLE